MSKKLSFQTPSGESIIVKQIYPLSFSYPWAVVVKDRILGTYRTEQLALTAAMPKLHERSETQ